MDVEISSSEPVLDKKALFQGWRLPDGLEFIPICISCFRTLRDGKDRHYQKATTQYLDVLIDGGLLKENERPTSHNDETIPLMCHNCTAALKKNPTKGLVSLLFRSVERIVQFRTISVSILFLLVV